MPSNHEHSQPTELATGERLASTGRAMGQAVRHQVKGDHATQDGAGFTTDPADVGTVLDRWPAAQKNVAQQMLDKYGPPNEATPARLVWHHNQQWKRTEITSDTVVHNWPAPHTDFLTQTIDYRVSPRLAHLLIEFDGSILIDRTKGEISARCDSESANVLSLNMVHEIVTGTRTVEQARHTLEQNKIAYTLGRDAPYAERLLFELPQGGTEDLDTSAISGAAGQQLVGKVKDLVSGEQEATDRRLPE